MNKKTGRLISILLIIVSICLLVSVVFDVVYVMKYRTCSTETVQKAATYGSYYAINNINNKLVEMVQNCQPLYVNTTNGIYEMSTLDCFNNR